MVASKPSSICPGSVRSRSPPFMDLQHTVICRPVHCPYKQTRMGFTKIACLSFPLMTYFIARRCVLDHLSNGNHYSAVIMIAMASQIIDVSIVYLTVCSGAD